MIKMSEEEKTPEEIEAATKVAEEAAATKVAEEEAAKVVAAEEDVVTIGKEQPPEITEDSSVIRRMRQVHKDIKTENRELKEKLAAASTDDKSVALGAKPTLEGCNYDADKFSVDLEKWHEKKEVIAKQQAKITADQQKQDADWQEKMNTYGEKKATLNVPDYDEAEESVYETFSEIQQGLIIKGADNPAVVIYALGKNPVRAKELAAITDHVKFVAAMSRLEAQMNVTKRKALTKPEKTITSSVASTGDSTLDKLRKEAETTCDYTKVNAYRRQLQDKGK